MQREEVIQRKAIEAKNKARWKRVNPSLTEESGIYILTRVDENGIRYAYIGQAKHILTRLAAHLTGYQHIDLSIKKHGLLDEQHPFGWTAKQAAIPEHQLDAAEREYIKFYAERGYQLRNKTSGGQDAGKVGINDNKPSMGYYDGKRQGRIDVIKELKQTLKYLQVTPKTDGKLPQRMLAKFWQIMGEDHG